MPETIRLPARLADVASLASLNRDVAAGRVVLDWTAVKEADAASLVRLLDGLSLDGDSDALGLGTVPEELSADIAAVLADTAESPAPKRKRPPTRRGPTPAEWRAPDDRTEGQSGGAIASVGSGRLGTAEEITTAAEVAPGSSAAPQTPPTRPVLERMQPREIRKQLLECIKRDLVGPAGGPEEVVTGETLRDRYYAGSLAPLDEENPAEEMDRLSDGAATASDQDGQPDDETAGRPTLLPSSIGLSFHVAGDVESLTVTSRYGRYRPLEKEDREESQKSVPKKRIPVEHTHRLVLSDGAVASWCPDDDPEHDGITVRGLVRRRGDEWAATVYLINGQQRKAKGQDAVWLFQVELEIQGEDSAPVFVQSRVPAVGRSGPTSDENVLAMNYRDVCEFAVGHGTAVHADVAPDDPTRAVRLTTRAMPVFEVGQSRAPGVEDVAELEGLVLDMKVLAESSDADLPARLFPLVEAYDHWIAGRRAEVAAGERRIGAWSSIAENALLDCETASRRIRQGIEALANPETADAFRFMNEAMWKQRIHSKLAQARRRGGDETFESFDIQKNRSWRPFQLAFVLLNVPSCADLTHPDRGAASVADLLWFPTGGGKTEAYLGVSAFVLGIRRLQGVVEGRRGDDGLAVLMRYTLRLLTLQQFQRAATLICACEDIRLSALERGDDRWGHAPFRIGLWVGQRATPNRTEDAHEAIRRLRGDGRWNDEALGSGSPHQLLHCPWCGTMINPGKHLQTELPKSGRGRTLTYCGDALGKCRFSRARNRDEGLPVMVVDEEMYRNPPSLLIATVDKFAQMPWKGEVRSFFGKVSERCERHGYRAPDLWDSNHHPKRGTVAAAKTVKVSPLRPPDLIIQDELHLISGPLGTLVGLYETAVDELSSWTVDGKKVRPKVIASTATVRRASDQVWQLFQRQCAVFPPPGLDAKDNFFSRQIEPSDEDPGRLYVGLCTPGRRVKATLIRAYVAAMASAQSFYERVGAEADAYMTTVGYFNSMRELGSMRRLVDDDIKSRLLKADQRGLARRLIDPHSVDELTSRKSAIDIPRVLDHLEIGFDPAKDAARKAGKKGPRRPLDVVLATNMISVGVDVERLGLMIVGGQPKNTAEYIQATSRVGRAKPGLVLTVFNWSRPRDLSHYEQFEHYHASFYAHVEPLSVTPFAARAVDRGLVGLLASLIRLQHDVYNRNAGAADVSFADQRVKEMVAVILKRAKAGTHSDDAVTHIEERIASLLDEWKHRADRADSATPLGYRKTKETAGLLTTPSTTGWQTFTCLTSLREVEPAARLVLRDDGTLDDAGIWSVFTGATP